MTEPTQAQPGTAVAARPERKMDLAAIGGKQHGGGMTFLPQNMQECVDFAQIMAKSDFAIPPKFRGNPGACLAVTIQAARWEADPFAVIQKAYVTKSKDGSERLAYEAQLFAAVINTRAPIIGRLQLIYSGEGQNRKVKVIGIFADTGEPRDVETPTIARIHPKNSPLWTSDPDQQLAYYGMRSWGRRWTPEILLGIYTPEELMEQELVDAPRPARPVATSHQVTDVPSDEGVVRAQPEPEPEPPVEVALDVAEELAPVGNAPITTEEAARMDETLAQDEPQATVTAAAAEEPSEEEVAHDEALDGWEAYLQRAKDGLLESELKTEADMDDYATATKAALAAADGITEDEKDDLRARFVSAYLNAKRTRGFGRARR